MANAADAWLHDPQDHEAYRRLVEAIRRRRAWLHPTLGLAAPNPVPAPAPGDPELTDALAEDRPPIQLHDIVTHPWPRGQGSRGMTDDPSFSDDPSFTPYDPAHAGYSWARNPGSGFVMQPKNGPGRPDRALSTTAEK